MSPPVTLDLADEAATLALGARLGRAARAGDVLALRGELGAGKTTLVHGLAAALGVDGPVPSPTFVLVREYRGRLPLVHVDAYRLDGEDDALAIGLDEHLPGDGVTAVEWAERIAELLPEDALTVLLEPHGDGRRATLSGPRLARWLGETCP
jgi:tRNA threonylcarbamoyladenosine biosynthesis protein TsaE